MTNTIRIAITIATVAQVALNLLLMRHITALESSQVKLALHGDCSTLWMTNATGGVDQVTLRGEREGVR